MNQKLREILVVHHSHTDWGYTSHPRVVETQHYQFIDQAVALCRQYRDQPPAERYRWTCESSWVVHGYLRARTARQRRAFLECVHQGEIEVAAMPLHPTPLADARTVAAALRLLDELRGEGIPISVALGCDINGLSWPWADALLDAGVNALGMAMNFTAGGGMKRYSAFHWQAVSGRKLLCWQGTHYNQGAYWGLNHEAYAAETVAPLRVAELRRYPYAKLLLQVTHIPPDNMGPHPRYLEYLARYNRLAQEHGWPRMRPATLREWFDFLKPQAKRAPTCTGDWTDWWAAGAASTPRETAALMEAQRRLGVAEQHGGDPHACAAARRQIYLGAEHTWGASTSASLPYQLSSVAGLAAKQNLIYEAAYAANETLRQTLRPRYVVQDQRFEHSDPMWMNVIGAPETKATVQPLRTMVPRKTTVDWDRWLGKNFAQVIDERPVDGSRDTWFAIGKFDKPEAHGRWPHRPRWKRSPLKNATVTRTVDGDIARFEVRFRLDTDGDPCAAYIQFPFRLAANTILADVGGAWADPRRENVPGSCHNWWTVHRGILLSSPHASLLWTTWDAPVVMFDAPCPSPPKHRNRLRPPVLVAWAFHNYWMTNFSVINHGELTFRFRVKFWPRRVDVREVERFCASDPLADYPQIAPAAGSSLRFEWPGATIINQERQS